MADGYVTGQSEHTSRRQGAVLLSKAALARSALMLPASKRPVQAC